MPQTQNKHDSHALRNTLIATGAVAAAGAAAAMILKDKKNMDKAKKMGKDLLDKGKEYVKNMDAAEIQKIAEQVKETSSSTKSSKTTKAKAKPKTAKAK